MLAAVSAGVLTASAPAFASGTDDGTVRVKLTGAAMLAEAQERGFDLDHGLERVPDGIEAKMHLSKAQELELLAMGGEILEPGEEFQWGLSKARIVAADALPRPAAPTVRIVRADYFSTKGQGFLYVEARTTKGKENLPGGDPENPQPLVTMTLESDSGPGTAFATPRAMNRFMDSGEYMFHRNRIPVDKRPDQIRVTATLPGPGGTTVTDGQAVGKVSDWLDEVTPLTAAPGYKYDFVDGYKHPQQLYARFEEMAQQYPEIAEIVRMPNQTNGYQRKAQATIGPAPTNPMTPAQSTVVVSSAAWGHEGGNGISVEMVERPGANLPLSVTVEGKAVKVHLAKDSGGALASTAKQVADAIEAGSQGLIDRAHPYRANEGTGIVPATTVPIVLTDFLSQKRNGAPAGEVPRGPYTIRALRIGKHRDGSKPGVLIQASDHAREWVPMTITLEAAERLVRNYATDPATRDIIDNTDIFLIPVNNPDGANYSFYNFASQRKNMTNHCPDAAADPGNRNAWGVDLNRNYRVGSGFDGYDGASDSCTSGNYMGPAELSEPESKNSVWLVEQYRNIKFMMSVHSNGGQLFWQPGAYIAEGRITTPRPPLGHESFYWQSAERILSHVRATPRQTVVQTEDVGGSSDVLYSSAGNVREDMYFNYGIFSFGWEVGGSVYDPNTKRFVDGSFQPPWPDSPLISGHGETLEYANGIMEMFRVAADWGRDKAPATSTLTPSARQFDSPTAVRFDTNEPATIYYTTDGTAPTLQSTRYKQTEFREPGEELWVDKTTTFKWFSVDAAGNVEPAGYDPNNPATANSYRSETINIGEGGTVGGTVPATLSLSLAGTATFDPFVPGVAEDYEASVNTNVISTAGNATLSVADPSSTHTGKLVNGAFALPEPLQVMATGGPAFANVGGAAAPTNVLTYDAPVSNAKPTITFKQAIKANDALRTGTYSKTLTFTLSTTNP
ncbi:M14 family metallopeptidase [Solirubrobacter deserti]|uniref:M14 family metallopeptidase n=1 Tax=Solirubrobacter deserti TaxID=2282478 RepID=A0ABT4RCC8_9ACTN|nr:M14 family metallopeptidase [Solirubrobacter deserti]MDA0136181.1 M14 family metallopeptidase [Solirubrobacter deserti]